MKKRASIYCFCFRLRKLFVPVAGAKAIISALIWMKTPCFREFRMTGITSRWMHIIAVALTSAAQTATGSGLLTRLIGNISSQSTQQKRKKLGSGKERSENQDATRKWSVGQVLDSTAFAWCRAQVRFLCKGPCRNVSGSRKPIFP
jgi:hypothetical protein